MLVQFTLWGLLLLLTVAMAYLDSWSFIYGAASWEQGRFISKNAVKCYLIGIPGFLLYIGPGVYLLKRLGVGSATLQMLFYFIILNLAMAFVEKTFLSWPWSDKAVALVVVSGMGWLIFRTS